MSHRANCFDVFFKNWMVQDFVVQTLELIYLWSVFREIIISDYTYNLLCLWDIFQLLNLFNCWFGKILYITNQIWVSEQIFQVLVLLAGLHESIKSLEGIVIAGWNWNQVSYLNMIQSNSFMPLNSFYIYLLSFS